MCWRWRFIDFLPLDGKKISSTKTHEWFIKYFLIEASIQNVFLIEIDYFQTKFAFLFKSIDFYWQMESEVQTVTIEYQCDGTLFSAKFWKRIFVAISGLVGLLFVLRNVHTYLNPNQSDQPNREPSDSISPTSSTITLITEEKNLIESSTSEIWNAFNWYIHHNVNILF